MPTRRNTLADARRLSAWFRLEVGRELRLSRINAGWRLRDATDRLGWSKSKLSRLERGLLPSLTLEDVATAAAVVGLKPSIRLYPTGRRLLDHGQLELLQVLDRRMSPDWTDRLEVPMPQATDLRAADQVSSIAGCRLMIEAIRRLSDFQAQSRSAQLKRRDLQADRLLLLIEDTHANRRALGEAGDLVFRAYPIRARPMLAAARPVVIPAGMGSCFWPARRRTSPLTLRVAQPTANEGR